MANDDKGRAASSDPLARAFVIIVAIALIAGIALGVRVLLSQRAAAPAPASQAQQAPFGVLDEVNRRIMAGVEQLSKALKGARPQPEPPVREQKKRAQAGTSGSAPVRPVHEVDPRRSYAAVPAPQGPQVLAVPADGQWAYEVSFGPAWKKGGRLHYVTEPLPGQAGKVGAGMSWLPEGGGASKWFLGVLEADHPSHANTRFPGFFMHPVYLPQSLQPGSRILWEFPWHGRGQVRRFDMRVMNWESVTVPAGEFTAVHLKGTLQYVDNEAVKAEVRYSLWYAPRARQVVRLLWLGGSPDEANGEMIAELASFTVP